MSLFGYDKPYKKDLNKLKLTAGLLKFVKKNIVNAPTESYARNMITWLNTCLNSDLIKKSYPKTFVLALTDSRFSPSQMLTKFKQSGLKDHQVHSNYTMFWDKLLETVEHAHDNKNYQDIVAELGRYICV